MEETRRHTFFTLASVNENKTTGTTTKVHIAHKGDILRGLCLHRRHFCAVIHLFDIQKECVLIALMYS